VFEALILNNQNWFIVSNYIIPDSQYGFRTSISTCHQLIHFINTISSAFDTNLICIDAIFLDYSSTFDTVSHLDLGQELTQFGILGQTLNLIISF
jgi:hypothetical protein